MGYIEETNRSAGMAPYRCYDKIDPLLVALHDSVVEYKSCDNKDNSKLTESVAAILDARLTVAEKSLASDVLIALIKQAEDDVRRNLSARLAHRNDLPAGLLHYLAYDKIDVAEAVLLYSPLLDEMDLMYIIQAKGLDHWRTIAKREHISDRIIDVLSDKKDEETILQLLRNGSVEIKPATLKKIGHVAMASEDILPQYINYHGLPRDMAVNIYWHVSNAMRQSIAKRFRIKPAELNETLQDCMQDFADTMLTAETMEPSKLMVEVAEMYQSQEKISDHMLVSTLRRRQGRFFIALFAERTSLSHNIIWSMMKQTGGQGLAVACRAMNVTKENFVSIFLLCRTITRSTQAVTAQELRMAMRYYDGLTLKMAREILSDSIAQ